MSKRFVAAYINTFHGKLELYGMFSDKNAGLRWIDEHGLKLGPVGQNRGDSKLWEVLEIQEVKDE
jgi:hypothetical protein